MGGVVVDLCCGVECVVVVGFVVLLVVVVEFVVVLDGDEGELFV